MGTCRLGMGAGGILSKATALRVIKGTGHRKLSSYRGFVGSGASEYG